MASPRPNLRADADAHHSLISEIISGTAPVEAETALLFEKELGLAASIWLGIERDYRLHQTRKIEAQESG